MTRPHFSLPPSRPVTDASRAVDAVAVHWQRQRRNHAPNNELAALECQWRQMVAVIVQPQPAQPYSTARSWQ